MDLAKARGKLKYGITDEIGLNNGERHALFAVRAKREGRQITLKHVGVGCDGNCKRCGRRNCEIRQAN